jgi:GDPmannose 4,6-dehydratase
MNISNKSQVALITGVTGQDGSYLAEFLLEKGYEVHGVVRRASTFNRERIDRHFDRDSNKGSKSSFTLHYADLGDSSSVFNLLEKIQPEEIYNLGAQSHVGISFDIPEYTADVTGLGTLRLLEAIRSSKLNCKFYQAGSSEMFGLVQENPQKETTPFYPRSPYGVAKVYAHWIAKNYRESFDMFISNGILFNHESPRRGENFVTRKITLGAAAIKLGMQTKLPLGNLDASRDWGYAKDFVEAMWMMLQQDEADDYVIATGESCTVREFCKLVFNFAGLDMDEHIIIDKKYFRPAEVDYLKGDPSKAFKKLGWKPKTSLKDLAKLMYESDLEYLKTGKLS